MTHDYYFKEHMEKLSNIGLFSVKLMSVLNIKPNFFYGEIFEQKKRFYYETYKFVFDINKTVA